MRNSSADGTSRPHAVLLVGCGYLGAAWLAQARAALGDQHTLYALARTPRPLPAHVHGIWADLHHPRLGSLLPAAGIDSVIFCAAADDSTPGGYRHLYIDGTARLLAAFAQLPYPPRRLIWTSSTSVYGHDDGRWVDEQTPATGGSWRGELMRQAEAVVAAAKCPSTRLRLAGIYGPGRMRLMQRIQQGWSPAERSEHYTNRIHRDDCVAIFNALILAPQVPAVLIGSDDHPATLGQIAADVRRRATGAAFSPWHTVDTTAAPAGKATGKRCSNALLHRCDIPLKFPSFTDGFC